MKSIIEVYDNWLEYQKTIDYKDVIYYETIFKCAVKRKGIMINSDLLKEYSKNNYYKYENTTILNAISTIPFPVDFDMFELQSRVLCDYLKVKKGLKRM